MNKLLVVSGVPGSGKSYFSNTLKKVLGKHVYVISSDTLRAVITGSQSDLSEDDLMWKVFYDLAKVYALDPNGVVLLDATNITIKKRIDDTKELKPLFDEIDLVIFNIDKQVVSNQNLQRDYPIAPDVLERFFEHFEPVGEEDRQYFNNIVEIKNNDITAAIEMAQSSNIDSKILNTKEL